MAQITLYLEDDTACKLRAAAETSGISVSSFVAELIRRKVATEWPDNVARLAGSWTDLPSGKEIRRGQPDDLPRESL